MVPPEIPVAPLSSAVMVRVHGPDPKGRKMRNHAFHHAQSGDTTLSASGWLLHCNAENVQGEGYSVVLTCASIVEPFLQKGHLSESSKMVKTPTLVAGTQVDVLLEEFESPYRDSSNDETPFANNSSSWLSAKLIFLVAVPLAGTALQALLDAHGGRSDGSWQVGWALTHMDTSRSQGTHIFSSKEMESAMHLKSYELQNGTGVERNDDNLAMATHIAVLGLPFGKLKIKPTLILAEPCRKGDFLLIVGSPFGVLSPLHFFNSMVVGIIANIWPPGNSQASLLMADIRCLPGMEGAPAFNRDGAFIGILARPLRQRSGGAEVQLVITWNALAPALKSIGIDLQACCFSKSSIYGLTKSPSFACGARTLDQYKELHGSTDHLHLLPGIEKAIASVVLVTVGDGAWASGVLINDKGLVLTNAHLLEPWRFGKTQFLHSQSQKELTVSASSSHSFMRFCGPKPDTDSLDNSREYFDKVDNEFPVQNVGIHAAVQTDGIAAVDSVVIHPASEINYRSYRKIRVRIEHPKPRTWCDARAVYVSRGPLDVALLQIETFPPGLQAMQPEEEYPIPGAPAVVIGHGLFGPRSDLCPSLSAGVVSRVVRTGNFSQFRGSSEEPPVMLETTAAVHPGGSGGAVVNEHGRMIGLVTSNARHSGGTVIPHLNFSIPFAALKPIFLYSSGDMKDLSYLSALGSPNEQLSAVWALIPPTPLKSTQDFPFLGMLPKQENKSRLQGSFMEKGSRFAKFLAEKTFELSKKPETEVNTVSSKPKLHSGSDDHPPISGDIYHSSRL